MTYTRPVTLQRSSVLAGRAQVMREQRKEEYKGLSSWEAFIWTDSFSHQGRPSSSKKILGLKGHCSNTSHHLHNASSYTDNNPGNKYKWYVVQDGVQCWTGPCKDLVGLGSHTDHLAEQQTGSTPTTNADIMKHPNCSESKRPDLQRWTGIRTNTTHFFTYQKGTNIRQMTTGIKGGRWNSQ